MKHYNGAVHIKHANHNKASYWFYGFAFVVALLVFGFANILNLYRRVWCRDCFFPYGMPFTFYIEGGEGGGAGIVWGGVVADIAAFAVTVVLLAWLLHTFKARVKPTPMP